MRKKLCARYVYKKVMSSDLILRKPDFADVTADGLWRVFAVPEPHWTIASAGGMGKTRPVGIAGSVAECPHCCLQGSSRFGLQTPVGTQKSHRGAETGLCQLLDEELSGQ